MCFPGNDKLYATLLDPPAPQPGFLGSLRPCPSCCSLDAIEDRKAEKMKESETAVTPKTPNVFDGPENEIQLKESQNELTP